MNKWSFCFISVGESPYLQRAVDSVREFGPKDSEIIVVGGEVIPKGIDAWKRFDENQGLKNWITRKKNCAAQLASNENVAMLHDYVSLEPGWAEGVRDFEFQYTCMHRVLNADGNRFRDWCAAFQEAWMNPPIDETPIPTEYGDGRLLNYSNNRFGRFQYYSGAYFCSKRQVLLDIPLNEERCHNGGEDIEHARRLYKRYSQAVFTMNPNASVKFLKLKENTPWQNLAELV